MPINLLSKLTRVFLAFVQLSAVVALSLAVSSCAVIGSKKAAEHDQWSCEYYQNCEKEGDDSKWFWGESTSKEDDWFFKGNTSNENSDWFWGKKDGE